LLSRDLDPDLTASQRTRKDKGKEKAQQRHNDDQDDGDDGEDMDTASGNYEERNCGDMERDLDENNVSDDTLGSNGDYSLPWEHWKQTSNDPSGYSQMAQPGVY